METESREQPRECCSLRMEGEREDTEDCSMWWSQLPNDLQDKAFSWLPVDKLCRYCGVCKEWNALHSSTEFISNDWVMSPPNKKPWLVWHHDLHVLDCTAYCFYTNTSKTISFAFLTQNYDVRGFSVHGSASGLFLVSILHPQAGTYVISYAVCNPLTRASLQLPGVNDGVIWVTNIVAGDNEDTYKVIAIVESRIEIYDSSLKSWSTAGQLPRNFRPHTFELEKPAVSGDTLYFKVTDTNLARLGIAGFNIKDGNFFLMPFNAVFTCGSRVLVASCISNLGGVIISEIENPQLDQPDKRGVREIARMPQSMVEHFRRKAAIHECRCLQFNFQGTRDMVYIRYGCPRCNELVVYNLSDNIWTWLLRCLVAEGEDLTARPGPIIFFFEPRPDRKVE